ncbi:MAG: DUF4190 domain-containing protein [Armatimonas sp.]
MALTLITLERRTEAVSRLEQALALDPGYEQARLRLSELGAMTQAPPPMPPLTPSVPEPPLVTLGGGTEITPPPPGTYAPPVRPDVPSSHRQSLPSPVSGTTPMVLGILGIVLCQILAPVAWILGANALKILDSNPNYDQSQRGNALAGKIMGIIGTVLLVLTGFAWVGIMILGAMDSSK